MRSESDDVQDFHRQLELWPVVHSPAHVDPIVLQQRIAFLQEELDEFREAVEANDLAKQADALIDLVYVAKGTALMAGLPWAELWTDVHSANMQKKRGPTKRGHAMDAYKPAGWQPPITEQLLLEAGYNREQWFSDDGRLLRVINQDRIFQL